MPAQKKHQCSVNAENNTIELMLRDGTVTIGWCVVVQNLQEKYLHWVSFCHVFVKSHGV